MRAALCLLPWVIWMFGCPIYKKIKHEDICNSKIYIPVIWILCILGNAVNLFIELYK